MCDEDGIKRALHNMKEKHAERGLEDREKQREDSGRKLEKKRTVFVSKKNQLLYQL